MEFRVLGSIEVFEDGRRLTVATGRQLAVLAFLLIHANRVISADRIVDELWGDEPPESGVKAVAFHVSRLRDVLEPGRPRGQLNGILATKPAGYVLHVAPDQIDGARFERLVGEGWRLLGDDMAAARARLAEALALWRGAPYADVADESWAQPEIRRLEELRLRVLEDRLEADLALGNHDDVVNELAALVAEHPLRERLRGQLMLALYRAGRQAEALRTYGEGRQVLADELGIDPGPELQQLEGWILRQDPRLEPPARRRSVRNPYKGLRPFGEHDSPDYFGREALVARLVERLGEVTRAGRLLAVVGASGSGKSSAVRAGLIPALRASALPGSERWRVAVMQPGARPIRELAAALDPTGDAAQPQLAERVAEQLDGDGDLAGAIAGVLPDDVPHLVLVIDQLEELWSLAEDAGERTRFVGALVGALAVRDARLLVVATLRADFLDRPLMTPGLGELVRAGAELITPLSRDELERAIVRPAESVGVQLEPGLATEVLADVARQPGELPLLQYALTELFEASAGGRLTRHGYAAVGGVLGALARQANATFDALAPGGREIARQAFLRLVSPVESGEPTARRVPRAELLTISDDPRGVDSVLDEFGRRRLLSFDRDAVTGEPTVQVAHEALLARWPRLAGWIAEAREDLWTRRRLADAASDWIHAARDLGFLVSGSRLDLFASWAAETDLRLDGPERELLDASLAERARQDAADAARRAHERTLERRATTRLRAVVAVLALAALVATSLSVVVYGQGETAREQGAIARARELVAGSIGNLGTDPGLSLLLAWEAAGATADRGYVVEEAMDALHWALQASHVAFPAGAAPVALRASPWGPRGVTLLAPDQLMDLAATAAGRGLSAEECRTYLHREACPAPPAASGATVPGVHTAAGIVPVERLASETLAGTLVDVVSQLPADLAPLVAAVERETGIDLALRPGADADLQARIAAGDLPDAAIVARPMTVAELARAGLLVDLAGIVDVGGLRATSGDYLASLGTVGEDGAWPTAEGRLYGATFAAEVASLVWYPKAAFERAGYAIPRTWDDLTALADRILADGGTPWCLGVGTSRARTRAAGASAADFVEEIVLQGSGVDAYERWTSGAYAFQATPVRDAFVSFGSVAFAAGSVLGGVGSAIRTPEDLAAWPMFTDPPGCWLHLAGGTIRGSWPAGAAGALSAFPFPVVDPEYAGSVRGRAYAVVVFHDRPEVRRFVDGLVGAAFATSRSAAFSLAGLCPVGLEIVNPASSAAEPDGQLLLSALRSGSFRVAASDLMPAAVAEAFAQGTVSYLAGGALSLNGVLGEIQHSSLDVR